MVADRVAELLDVAQFSDAAILDLGCGDGLVGEALKVRGFNNISGYDISSKMVSLAIREAFIQFLSVKVWVGGGWSGSTESRLLGK